MYSFDDIKGNEQIIKNLKSAVLNNKVSHAYIFDAPKGMGKNLIARTFAKTLVCVENNGKPCNNCSSCIKFDVDNNPDIIYVKSERKTIGVEIIRDEINNEIVIKPYESKYKVFIIESADTMTVQAQNALLKTIEEPPMYAVFILLSENFNSFLDTILSRCVMFKLKPVEFNTVKKYLTQHIDINDNMAHTFALYAQGNIGRAMEIASSEDFISMRDDILNVIEEIEKADLTGIYKIISRLELYKENIQECLDIIYMTYRDAVILKNVGFNSDFIIQRDKHNIISKIASNNSLSKLIKSTEIVFNAKRQLKINANFQLTLEVMLLKIKGE